MDVPVFWREGRIRRAGATTSEAHGPMGAADGATRVARGPVIVSPGACPKGHATARAKDRSPASPAAQKARHGRRDGQPGRLLVVAERRRRVRLEGDPPPGWRQAQIDADQREPQPSPELDASPRDSSRGTSAACSVGHVPSTCGSG